MAGLKLTGLKFTRDSAAGLSSLTDLSGERPLVSKMIIRRSAA